MKGDQSKLALQQASLGELDVLSTLYADTQKERDGVNQPFARALGALPIAFRSYFVSKATLKATYWSLILAYMNLWSTVGIELDNKENETLLTHVVGLSVLLTFFFILPYVFTGAYFDSVAFLINKIFPEGITQGVFADRNALLASFDLSEVKTKAQVQLLTRALNKRKEQLNARKAYVQYVFGGFSLLLLLRVGRFMDKYFGGVIASLVWERFSSWRSNRAAKMANEKQVIQLLLLRGIQQATLSLGNELHPQKTYFCFTIPEKLIVDIAGQTIEFDRKSYLDELLFALNDTAWTVDQLDGATLKVEGNSVLGSTWLSFYRHDPVEQINAQLDKQLHARAEIRAKFSSKRDQLRSLGLSFYPILDRVDSVLTAKFVVPMPADETSMMRDMLQSLYGCENVSLSDYSDSHIIVSGVNLADAESIGAEISSRSELSAAFSREPERVDIVEFAGVPRKRQRGKGGRLFKQQPAMSTTLPKETFSVCWTNGCTYNSEQGANQDVFPIRVPWAPGNIYFGVIEKNVEHTFFGGNGRPPITLWDGLREIARRGEVVLNDTSSSKAGGVGTVFEKTIHAGKAYDVVVKNAHNMGLFGQINPARGASENTMKDGRAVLIRFNHIAFRH